MPKPKLDHEHLLSVMRTVPTDYADFGGEVVRWSDPALAYPDCSYGCRWAVPLKGRLADDWCVCAKPDAPREGLLTFEHQAGFGCYEA